MQRRIFGQTQAVLPQQNRELGLPRFAVGRELHLRLADLPISADPDGLLCLGNPGIVPSRSRDSTARPWRRSKVDPKQTRRSNP